MNINLQLEATFSLGAAEDSDIFLQIVCPDGSEVASSEITFEKILENSFEQITDEDERELMKRKITGSMLKFLNKFLNTEGNRK